MSQPVPVPGPEFCMKSPDGKHDLEYEPNYTDEFELVGSLIVCKHCGNIFDDVPHVPADREREWERLGEKLEAEAEKNPPPPHPRFRPWNIP